MNKWKNGVLPMVLMSFSTGSVYCWTLFRDYIRAFAGFENWVVEWSFSLAIFFLGATAALGGRLVERSVKTSSWITFVCFTSGWFLTGIGIQLKNPWIVLLGFGVVQGIGLGFGYLVPIKTLMMWFDKRKGFAAGLAITGFGLAGVVANPIIALFIEAVPIYAVFYILASIYGVAIFIAAVLFHRPESAESKVENKPVSIRALVYNKKFVLLWIALFINISCGLALMSHEKQIYTMIGVSNLSFIVIFCSVNAVGNLLGRICMASLQDKLHYKYIPYYVMAAASLFVCVVIYVFPVSVAITVITIFVVQFFFGCGFACLPNILYQNYGMRQLATVQGLMLSAWAIAGLFGNQLAAFVLAHWDLRTLYFVLGSLYAVELVILIYWAWFVLNKNGKPAAILRGD